MATLHLLSHSPFGDDRFASCLRLLGADDGILLTGDAVYAVQAGSAPFLALGRLNPSQRLFALEEDLQARALTASAGLEALDYPGFVELSLRYAKVNSWL